MTKEEFIEFLRQDKEWRMIDENEYRAYDSGCDYTERWAYILVAERIYGWTELEDGYDEGGCDSVKYKTYEDLIRSEF